MRSGAAAAFDSAFAVAIQADGKIVVAGYSWNGSEFDFALARYNADGSLDTSFDGDGKVTTDFGASSTPATASPSRPTARSSSAGYATAAPTRFRPGALQRRRQPRHELRRRRQRHDRSRQQRRHDHEPHDPGRRQDRRSRQHLPTMAVRGFRARPLQHRRQPRHELRDGGKVVTPVSAAADDAREVVLQSDGKIVVVGRSFGEVERRRVAEAERPGDAGATSVRVWPKAVAGSPTRLPDVRAPEL